jgi:hypothetical protein
MRRQIGILLSIIIGAVGAYFGQPLAHDNSDAVLVLITVMTVFAGFLVAIIAVLGDPALIPGESWDAIELRRDGIHAKLIRHQVLFIFYLIAIGLLFIGVLINKAPLISISMTVKIWIERLYLFFGISSFCFTFGLPWALLKLQLTRLETETDKRRRQAGIKDRGDEA